MEKLIKDYSEVFERFAQQKNEIHRLWNVGIETANLLVLLVKILNPNIILELGTSNGFSTFHLALLKTAKVITIDVEDSRQKLAKENLKQFKNIRFITERIEDYLPKIDFKIDMLFIDANKTHYLKYLKSIEKHLKNNAIVIADNIDSHGESIRDYREYVTSSPKYISTHISIEAGLLVSLFNNNDN